MTEEAKQVVSTVLVAQMVCTVMALVYARLQLKDLEAHMIRSHAFYVNAVSTPNFMSRMFVALTSHSQISCHGDFWLISWNETIRENIIWSILHGYPSGRTRP
jgi:hypothetical protein